MRRGGARFRKQHFAASKGCRFGGKKQGNEIRKRFLSEKISRRRNRRNQFRYYTLTLLAFCLTMTTYLCTIPFATSFLATFKSKFASPLEEPSNFTFPTDAALTQNFDGVALLVVVAAEEVAVLLFKDWPLNDAHKLCMFAVDAVKDIFACVCIYFYCCFRTTKSDDEFSFFPSLSPFTHETLPRPFFWFLLLCSLFVGLFAFFLSSPSFSGSSKKKKEEEEE